MRRFRPGKSGTDMARDARVDHPPQTPRRPYRINMKLFEFEFARDHTFGEGGPLGRREGESRALRVLGVTDKHRLPSDGDFDTRARSAACAAPPLQGRVA